MILADCKRKNKVVSGIAISPSLPILCMLMLLFDIYLGYYYPF